MKYKNLFSAFNHPLRFDILVLLSNKELCICELEHLLEAKQYQISRHMKILKDYDLVCVRKQRKYRYYSLNNTCTYLLSLLDILVRYPDEQVRILKNKLLELDKIPFVCESRG